MIYELTEKDLLSLDGFECYTPGGKDNAYERKTMRISRPHQEPIECEIYIANADSSGALHFDPSDHYLQTIEEGLLSFTEQGISKEYLQDLRQAALGPKA